MAPKVNVSGLRIGWFGFSRPGVAGQMAGAGNRTNATSSHGQITGRRGRADRSTHHSSTIYSLISMSNILEILLLSRYLALCA